MRLSNAKQIRGTFSVSKSCNAHYEQGNNNDDHNRYSLSELCLPASNEVRDPWATTLNKRGSLHVSAQVIHNDEQHPNIPIRLSSTFLPASTRLMA
jgi:hypothetical protein